jgi:putative oxidoreductase
MNTIASYLRFDTSTSAWNPARVLETDARWTLALTRLTLAAVLWPHGAQHLLGWFGGSGFSATLAWMTETLGVPAVVAALAIVFEFVGPLALALGIGARAVGLGLAGFMAVAASTHLQNGFFMNWFGQQPAGVEGVEYHLLAMAMALVIAGQGGGAASLDLWLTRRWRRASNGR